MAACRGQCVLHGLQLLSLSVPHAHLFVLCHVRLCAVPFGAQNVRVQNGTHEDDGAQTVHGDGALFSYSFRIGFCSVELGSSVHEFIS